MPYSTTTWARSLLCLIVAVSLSSSCTRLCAQTAGPKYVSKTFQDILSRVAERDGDSHAILLVKPKEDAPRSVTSLTFWIEQVPGSDEAMIALTVGPSVNSDVYETYRLKIDDALADELDNRDELEVNRQSRKSSVLLNLQHVRQDTNLCVVACAAMALKYYGEDRDQHELKALSTPEGSTFEGTLHSDLVNGVAKIGYRWEQRRYTTDTKGFDSGFRRIIRWLRKDRPVLVGLSSPPIGHTVLVVGFDSQAHTVTLLDPNMPMPGTRIMTFGKFKEAWREDLWDLRSAVFTGPKP